MNDRAPDSTRPLCTYANAFKAPRNPTVCSTQVTEVATALHALNMVISASGFENLNQTTSYGDNKVLLIIYYTVR